MPAYASASALVSVIVNDVVFAANAPARFRSTRVVRPDGRREAERPGRPWYDPAFMEVVDGAIG